MEEQKSANLTMEWELGTYHFGWVCRRNPSESLMMQQEEEEFAFAISGCLSLINSVSFKS